MTGIMHKPVIKIWHNDDHHSAVQPDIPALKAVRHNFNPSSNRNVSDLKALAAAFIELCHVVEKEIPEGARDFACARTFMETASMWAVKGATA